LARVRRSLIGVHLFAKAVRNFLDDAAQRSPAAIRGELVDLKREERGVDQGMRSEGPE